MRIAVFDESKKAFAEVDRMRAEGNKAFIRNPHFFNPDNFDAAFDLIISDDKAVLTAFQAKGIKTATLTEAAAVAIPVKAQKEIPVKSKSIGRPKKM